ncbi:MAG: phosphoglucosamine mutase [Prevotellaceae bacterium]|jgi:phosphomannomutase|nr:phosphoglucosamine mutase [Prevotellaceae bacterium]
MTLIKSISGIRGTIGGRSGEALTPVDLVKFTAGYAGWLHRQTPGRRLKVVVGRDARVSGEMLQHIVCGTLMACGVDVVYIGLATTPTTELAVVFEQADGGIVLTASHNPAQWNALKLLNGQGEFLDAAAGRALLELAEQGADEFAEADRLGVLTENHTFTGRHIEAVLQYPLVDVEAIYRAGFKVVVDAVNSVGGVAIPALLEALGVGVVPLFCEPTGRFAHNPEPLPDHLGELSARVVAEQAGLGVAVDPDVDRLAIVCEDGSMFGEEYTLVAVADYILSKRAGHTVSNLSSSRALRDVTERYGRRYFASAVGEVHVVNEMKRVQAVVGGEGNGGVIVPDFHYGRDALIGLSLFLSLLANKGASCSQLRDTYPRYYTSKNKLALSPQTPIEALLEKLTTVYADERITTGDGVRIDFDREKKWIHLRKSNTEPIVRLYAEAPAQALADALAAEVMALLVPGSSPPHRSH